MSAVGIVGVPSRWARVTAAGVDGAILMAAAVPVAISRWSKRSTASWKPSAVNRLPPLLPLLAQGAYFVVPTVLLGGSPGQLFSGLRVVDVDSGRRPSWGQAAVRWFVWVGPGLVARIAIRTRSRREAERVRDRLRVIDGSSSVEEPCVEPDPVLMSRAAKSAGVSAAVILVLVVYQLTIGRNARDRVTRTMVVRVSPRAR